MRRKNFLAFDLGAESGRAVVGTLENDRFELREVHRFPNAPLPLFDRLHWDVYALLDGIKAGLRACAAAGLEIESAAVDTWGVDFGLLAADGSLLGLPFAYRDPRNPPAMADFLARFPRDRVYERTGNQFLPFNSLFQLHALKRDNEPLLRAADRFLMMPDLLTYFLCGSKTNEATIASTSQLIDPRLKDWSGDLLEAVGVSPSLFRRPCEPGLAVGTLLPALAKETGLPEVPIIATASHDTASAVAAVPAEGKSWAYISSGTWSLIGIESPAPIITPETLRLNFTNEGGMGGTIRFLKNVAGLWLLQQCRKKWSAERPISYDEMKKAALEAPPFEAFVDPDAPEFLNPEDMPEAIRSYCRATGQAPPDSKAAVIRCCLESLALKSRDVIEQLRLVSPQPIEKIHIIGGGSRNEVLNQFTANAARTAVAAGPVEATALGNIMGQALALGEARTLAEMRRRNAAAVAPETFEPRETAAWDRAYARFAEILRREP